MKKRKKKTARKVTTSKRTSIRMLEAENARLTAKCHERSNECYLLKVQKNALEEQMKTLREAYKQFDSTLWKTLRP